MKKFQNCVKCNREIKPTEETYHDMCFDCYKEFLLDKIEHLDDERPIFEKPEKQKISLKEIPQKILDSLKEIFREF